VKASDIVKQLSLNVPLYTDGFSTSVDIASASVAGTTVTVTTAGPHGLKRSGQTVTISGMTAPVQIDAGSFQRVGGSAMFNTLQDHDLTLSERDKASGGKTITISGANEAEFNGTFQLLSIPNRRAVVMAVADSGPAAISGAPLVDDAGINYFNVVAPATELSPTTFRYEIAEAYPLAPITSNAKAATSLRILAVLDIERYLQDIYTKKEEGDDVLVVQLGDVTQSKNRNEETDAADSSSGEYSFVPTLIQPFAVYIVQNLTGQLTGAKARDKVEEEYVPAIFKALLRADFSTGFTYSGFRSTFTGHGTFAYADPNGKRAAIYAHEVAFQQLVQLSSVDGVAPTATVAMRDVDYTVTTDLGTGELIGNVNLDADAEPQQ